MKYQLLPVVLLFVFALNGYPADGQNIRVPIPKKARIEADYQRRTLKEIAALGVATANDRPGEVKDGLLITADIVPSQVVVTYTGLIRPLRDRQHQVLLRWAARYAGAMETYTKPYQSEMLFVEDGAEYWLTVKSRDIPKLQQSLQAGKKVKLNVIRMGGVEADNGWDWLLLVESFLRL